MNFNEQLNNYIEQINCTSKQLADTSNISAPVISRFRNGEKLPNSNTSQLDNLSYGLSVLAGKKGLSLSKEEIYKSLEETLTNIDMNMELIRTNFNVIISLLNINISNLSRSIGFDASLISRIRSGQRTPSDPQSFVNLICNYIVTKYKNLEDKKAIANLINCKFEDIKEQSIYFTKLNEWFCSGTYEGHNYIDDFLKKLDDFDLDEYIRLIHFNELKVPSIPFHIPTSKNYYGIEEMKQGELDFFKATVLSKSTESIFMCSDMPMEDMAEDVDFGKKWMFAIAMTLKKELHLNIIHNLDRPFNEMMLGLESWIPIYMTGQVSPYYLPSSLNNIYCHFNYTSGNVALTGECIKGFHNKGKYYLTNNKNEVSYYKEKSSCLLNKAKPLMDIYTKETSNVYKAFIIANSKIDGNRKMILSTPPIYTISEEILLEILEHNSVPSENKSNIFNFFKEQTEITNSILVNNTITAEITKLSKEEFEKYPVSLSLYGMFYENKIYYTYEEYLKHFELTEKFATKNKNYIVKTNTQNAFRNIQIHIHEGQWVMVSKDNNPTINFVIKHPKLKNAIENFVAPVIE